MKNLNLKKNFILFYLNLIMLMMTLQMNLNNLMFYIIMLMLILPSNMKFLNPMFLNIFIIIMTLIFSMMFYILLNSNWFSMILFLVMIGGMMILFLYFNSFAINEYFSFNKNYLKNLFFKFMLFFLMMNLNNNYIIIQSLMIKKNIFNSNFNTKFLEYMNEDFLHFLTNDSIYNFLIILITLILYILIITSFFYINKNYTLRKMI